MIHVVMVGVDAPGLSDYLCGQLHNIFYTSATYYAHNEIANDGCNVLVITSASRRLLHEAASTENTSRFLHELSNASILPSIVIVILESDEHTGLLLAHQVNGCAIHELKRYDTDRMPELLTKTILDFLS